MKILSDDGETIVYQDDDGRTFKVHRSKRRRYTRWRPSRTLLAIIFFAVLIATCF